MHKLLTGGFGHSPQKLKALRNVVNTDLSPRPTLSLIDRILAFSIETFDGRKSPSLKAP